MFEDTLWIENPEKSNITILNHLILERLWNVYGYKLEFKKGIIKNPRDSNITIL